MTEENVYAALRDLRIVEPDDVLAKCHRAAILNSKVATSHPHMTPKPWYRSKTIWFNALTILIAVATVFGFTINQELFEQATNVLIILSPIVNLLLRFKTKKPVTLAEPTTTEPLA